MKKKLSPELFKIVTEVTAPYIHLIKAVDQKDTIAVFIDKDPNSDLYFEISKFSPQNGNIFYEFSAKPFSKHNPIPQRTIANTQTIQQKLKEWCDIIKEFEETPNIFDDSILKAYQQEIEEKFTIEIVDEKNEDKPFTFNQQDRFISLLNKTKELLEKHNEIAQSIEINQAIQGTIDLIPEVTSNTRKNLIQKFSKILAVVWKHSFDVIKEILGNLASDLIAGGS
jgi:hypothetical protein